MGRDDIRTIGVTIRDGWEQAFNGGYELVVDDSVRGFVWRSYEGSGWVGGIVVNGRVADPHQYRITTLEEAMIWVETTYALTRK
jgi:hypothetical protein